MKIAVCAQGQGMEAPVDPRFGRCRYFVIVDTENETVDSKQNSAAGAPGGAGIQAAQFIANQGVDVLLTGNIGPNASSVIVNSGIRVFTGVHGTVGDTIDSYQAGELNEVTGATVGPKYGGGFGPGSGRGSGRGRRRR